MTTSTTASQIFFNNTTASTVTGASGQYLTTNGSNGSTWVNPVLTVQNAPAGLEVKGTIIHNGKDLEERLNTIEKVLMIPERDVKLEAKHPKLKKLYDAYIKELEKYRTWERLKGDD